MASGFTHGCWVSGVAGGEGGFEVSAEGDVVLDELQREVEVASQRESQIESDEAEERG